MKKILVVNDFPIFPIVHGGKVRIFNIYKNISSKFQITYVCLGNSQIIEEKQISENFREISVPKTFFYKKIILIAKKLMGGSVDDFVALFFASYNAQLKKIIKPQIQECDVVILCHPYMYPSVKPYLQKQIVIYEALNVEFGLKDSILPDTLLKKIVLDRLKQTEQDLLQRCDLCFSMCDEDKQKFTQIYGVESSKISIAPNGVDEDFYANVYAERTFKKERIIPVPLIIFLASGHPPNVEAAQQIIKNIAPKLPNAYFLIAGSVCWMIHNGTLGKNVGLAYFITDEEKGELFRLADIAINPMMSGSGTNLKMLDYMAAGLPVVSTGIGARGISIQNRVHAVICDVETFPEEISHLINKKDVLAVLSRNGRQLVKDHYCWKNIANSMIEEIEKRTGEKK
ncbi:glycosyltransferase family 4 protein [Methanoregula sp.]|jgi:glycosyltransferase involved in cell wall biosynthesis|uniref:glycosyltransferase family 4 protein n=1 Tax=Methanoregula sp. TaxID=2052170 RepID=UPI0035686F7C